MVFLGGEHHADGRCGGGGIHPAAHGGGEHIAGIPLADLVSGKVFHQRDEVGQFRAAAGNHQTAAQGVLQAAFLNVVQDGFDDFAAAAVDDFGDVAYRDLLERRLQPDLQDFLAQRSQFAGHAGAEAFLDLFGQVFGDGAFGADVVGNHFSAEGNGSVVTHDAAVVDGHGSYAGPHVDQRDAAGPFIVREDCVGHHFRQEVFLGDGNVHLVENLVEGRGGAAVAHEHLEVALQGCGEGAHHLALHQLDFVVGRERLGHGAVHDLLFGIGEGIGLQGHGFEVLHLFGGDIVVGIGPLDAGRCGDLRHFAAGHAHDNLQNLDHQFLLGLPDGFLETACRLHRIGDETGADALGRGFLVVHNLDVFPVHAGDAESEFRTSQINRGNVFLFHIVLFYFLQTSCLRWRISTRLYQPGSLEGATLS